MAPQARKKKTRATKSMKTPPKSLQKGRGKESIEKPKRAHRSKASFSWTDLPFDPLSEIANRLPLKSRYILGFVCTTWSLFVSTILPPLTRKPSFPWLVSQVNNSSVFQGVHIPTKCVFTFGPYDQIEGSTCIGCQNGWLILVNRRLIISFFNPVSECHVVLPQIRNDGPVPLDITSIKKVVFSLHPNSAECVIALVLNVGGRLRYAYTTTTQNHWSSMFDTIHPDYIYDILRWEGSEDLHVITADAKLQLITFHANAYPSPYFVRIKAMATGVRVKKTLYWDWPRKSTQTIAWNNCMVVTKDLVAYEISRRIKMSTINKPARVDDFSVDCWTDCLCESCKMHFCKVPQKYDAEKRDASVAVKGKKPLKGHSFFVAENQAIAINAKGLSGFESDTIYYVDTCRNNKSWSGGKGRFDVLVLDVAKKMIKEYSPPLALLTWPPPYWFVPMMPELKKKKKRMRMTYYGFTPAKVDEIPSEYNV